LSDEQLAKEVPETTAPARPSFFKKPLRPISLLAIFNDIILMCKPIANIFEKRKNNNKMRKILQKTLTRINKLFIFAASETK
jgi:hypothetical protein